MKKQRKIRLSALKNRMVFRLWAFMMIPVMFGIGFMWVVQIFLFEQNYANAAVNEALNRLSPVMEDLRTRDIGEDEKLLSFISHIGGELLLVSEDGTLIKNVLFRTPGAAAGMGAQTRRSEDDQPES